MTLREFQKRRAEVEQARRKADRLAGVLDQFTERLSTEFGCSSVEKAEEMLEDLEKEAEQQVKALNREWGKWKKKWGAKI